MLLLLQIHLTKLLGEFFLYITVKNIFKEFLCCFLQNFPPKNYFFGFLKYGLKLKLQIYEKNGEM